MFKPTKLSPVDFDLTKRDYLHYVLSANEQLKFIELGKTMMAAGRQGLFDAWSLANQDLVQAAAHAYGERIVSSILKSNSLTNKKRSPMR